MRCYICNAVLEDDSVNYNEDHGDYDPCPSCLSVIEDLTSGFGDRAVEPEDDLTDILPLLEGLYPTVIDPDEYT